jgi:hypothetical protein
VHGQDGRRDKLDGEARQMWSVDLPVDIIPVHTRDVFQEWPQEIATPISRFATNLTVETR